MKYNYKIVVEVPRELRTRHTTETVVDSMTQYFYNKKNKESALRSFGTPKNLATLRKQGFRITRTEFKKYKNRFHIERV